MRITNITNLGIKYTVTKEPNWFERLFGMKTKTEVYVEINSTYQHNSGATVFIDETGEVIGWTNKMTKILDNYKRKKQYFGNN